MVSPVIRCGWCSKPVPQPEDGSVKLHCGKTHSDNVKKKIKGKKVTPPTRDMVCFGCGEKRQTSTALRKVMAICPDCHWMTYSMCWRKTRIPDLSGFEMSYECPVCGEWHWTKREKQYERSLRELEIQKKIGDYVRRMGYSEEELRNLPPYGWEAVAA